MIVDDDPISVLTYKGVGMLTFDIYDVMLALHTLGHDVAKHMKNISRPGRPASGVFLNALLREYCAMLILSTK